MSRGSRNFTELLERMTSAVCAGDAKVAAECFTPDGVYRDGFYGEFTGRKAIANMITGLFHRDASDFVWHVSDACSDERMGCARYRFAYLPKIAGSEGGGLASRASVVVCSNRSSVGQNKSDLPVTLILYINTVSG